MVRVRVTARVTIGEVRTGPSLNLPKFKPAGTFNLKCDPERETQSLSRNLRLSIS